MMDQAVLLILIVFGGTVVGLILTADNEPPPPMKVEKEERLHYVDKIPGHDEYNITIIKNPNVFP